MSGSCCPSEAARSLLAHRSPAQAKQRNEAVAPLRCTPSARVRKTHLLAKQKWVFILERRSDWPPLLFYLWLSHHFIIATFFLFHKEVIQNQAAAAEDEHHRKMRKRCREGIAFQGRT